jgi:hypothetical protein
MRNIGYQFFIAAANMPKHCLHLRTKLQIEYCRLLDWSEVAGMIEYEYGQDLPEILRADKLVLVAILTQIKTLMDDFAALNGKYVQLKPGEAEADKVAARDVDLTSEFSSVELKYEANALKRKHMRGTNHMFAMVKNVKDVASEPKRLRWVAFDEQVFKDMLCKLVEFNDYLRELLDSHHARKLDETTRNTYLEMVQVRSSVEQLQNLFAAAMVLGGRDISAASTGGIHGEGNQVLRAQRENDLVLKSLAQFKNVSIATDMTQKQKPSEYTESVKSVRKEYTSVSYSLPQSLPQMPSASGPSISDTFSVAETLVPESGEAEVTEVEDTEKRAIGQYYPGTNQERQIWIEWKPYQSKYHSTKKREEPLKENVTRVSELVALLQMNKPAEFCVPTCLGYFDDRDDELDSEHPERFGLIFEKPKQALKEAAPVSLLEAISHQDCPSLTDRVALAHKISTSILYLHAVRWLHKGICSDCIIFFPASPGTGIDISYGEPYLSGFEYSRPDRDGVTTATQRPLSDDVYQHPSYQGVKGGGTYRKTYDIYSLGIVLLEIAYWKPIPKIIEFVDPAFPTEAEVEGIRSTLLADGSNYLGMLKAGMGRKYWSAVETCIKGGAELDVGEKDNEMDVIVGAKLQRAFTEKVVGNLAAIVT